MKKTLYIILVALSVVSCQESALVNQVDDNVNLVTSDLSLHTFTTYTGENVVFAPGNLQYQASTGTWRFAYNQYDAIGNTNAKISSTYNGYIDLFGFGTSGSQYKPYNSELTATLYAQSDIDNTNNDWGVYCQIINGGNYKWHTLTDVDWVYICEYRTDADKKRSRATVNDVCGYILLPDDWTLPSNCSFTPDATSYTTNKYSEAKWESMEKAGAVFLPVTGHRKEKNVTDYNNLGTYYSSSWDEGGTSDSGETYPAQPTRFCFSDEFAYFSAIYTGTSVFNAFGSAVRLVRTVGKSSSKAPSQMPQKIAPHAIPATTKGYNILW